MGIFDTFNKNMRQRAKNVSLNADQIVRKCALAIDGAVVIATPVDTGRARSNWQVENNGPNPTTIQPYSPGREGSTGGANSRAAIEQGKAKIAAYKGSASGGSIHITNNLSYIGRLNNGSSKQAPAGFVEKAMLIGINAIKNRVDSLTTSSNL